MKRSPVLLTVLIAGIIALPSFAQNAPSDHRDDFMRHFEGSSRKMISLSEAVPQDKYDWSPGEGVFSIARVYAHIARYNYYYPETALGIPVPDDIDLESLEELTNKEQIRAVLERSVEHIRNTVGAMSDEDLTRETTLYGRTMPAWGVLSQLISHMNEHVGQAVAYARMNGIVPPWSGPPSM